MAKLAFLSAFDIRGLPSLAPRPGSGGLVFEEDNVALRLGEPDILGYRPKVAAAAPLGQGTISEDGVVVARITDLEVPALLLAGERGAGLARAMLAGDDVIRGSAGADLLFGFGGCDTLTGGRGADALTGGGGADVFRFITAADSRAGAPDTITDFAAGHDTLDLRPIDAAAGVKGNQAFDFIGAADFSGTAGELRLAGRLLEADRDGDGLADFAIRFAKGVPGAEDILF